MKRLAIVALVAAGCGGGERADEPARPERPTAAPMPAQAADPAVVRTAGPDRARVYERAPVAPSLEATEPLLPRLRGARTLAPIATRANTVETTLCVTGDLDTAATTLKAALRDKGWQLDTLHDTHIQRIGIHGSTTDHILRAVVQRGAWPACDMTDNNTYVALVVTRTEKKLRAPTHAP